mgnify:CR=1 FL=1
MKRPPLYTFPLAFFRLSMKAVCEWAAYGYDYHDYPDDIYGHPMHFVTMECQRCGKKFRI